MKSFPDHLYVDTGDALFSGSIIVDYEKESTLFNARNLAKGLSRLGLKYMVPGDQDLAGGWQFLEEIRGEVDFEFLISNAKSDLPLKSKSYAIETVNGVRFFMLGILAPGILNHEKGKYLNDPIPSIRKGIKTLKSKGFDSHNPRHRLVLLSHSGTQRDAHFAKVFPEFNWIVGAHTQRFNNIPDEENGVKLVQVLSQNHYLGKIGIVFPFRDNYKPLEMRTSWGEKLLPNPFVSFITEHKKQLTALQKKEQDNLLTDNSGSQEKYKTYFSCASCHNKQAKKWKSTGHSLAYLTLIKANQPFDNNCIGCHSLGHKEERGFKSTKRLVLFDSEVNPDKYWAHVKKAFLPKKAVRDLSPEKRIQILTKWDKYDESKQVSHNFSNVQCLNCHQRHPEHPFEDEEQKPTKKASLQSMKSACLQCHTPAQSPEWYNGSKLVDQTFKKSWNQISCSR